MHGQLKTLKRGMCIEEEPCVALLLNNPPDVIFCAVRTDNQLSLFLLSKAEVTKPVTDMKRAMSWRSIFVSFYIFWGSSKIPVSDKIDINVAMGI